MQYLIILIIFAVKISVEGKKLVFIDRFEVCYLQPNGPFFVGNITIINKKGENSYAVGEGELFRDLKNEKLELPINITRCATKELLDSCESYGILKPPNLCFFLNLKNVAWESVVYGFRPPYKCPFKKGKFIGEHITLDFDKFDLFPVDQHSWRFQVSLVESGITLVTFCIEARLKSRN